jgi:hypothetical protein
MKNIRAILSKALEADIITVPEWNKGICIYVVYRVVPETNSHYLLYAFDSEEAAKSEVERFKDPQYHYQELRLN